MVGRRSMMIKAFRLDHGVDYPIQLRAHPRCLNAYFTQLPAVPLGLKISFDLYGSIYDIQGSTFYDYLQCCSTLALVPHSKTVQDFLTRTQCNAILLVLIGITGSHDIVHAQITHRQGIVVHTSTLKISIAQSPVNSQVLNYHTYSQCRSSQLLPLLAPGMH